jgi:hypothetical protein
MGGTLSSLGGMHHQHHHNLMEDITTASDSSVKDHHKVFPRAHHSRKDILRSNRQHQGCPYRCQISTLTTRWPPCSPFQQWVSLFHPYLVCPDRVLSLLIPLSLPGTSCLTYAIQVSQWTQTNPAPAHQGVRAETMRPKASVPEATAANSTMAVARYTFRQLHRQ